MFYSIGPSCSNFVSVVWRKGNSKGQSKIIKFFAWSQSYLPDEMPTKTLEKGEAKFGLDVDTER